MAMLPDSCRPCARRLGTTCIAFQRPSEMWVRSCPGYTEDAEAVARQLEDCARYAERHGGQNDVTTAWSLLRRYRQQVLSRALRERRERSA